MTLDREAIRARFEAEGITVKAWAEQHGYNPRTVRAVLYGETKNTRGITHEIAVALGLKAKPAGSLRAA